MKKIIFILKPILFIAIFAFLINTCYSNLCINQKWSEIDREYVHVHKGDTLWHIASNNCPEDMDIREYIDYIKIINDIDVNLCIGDRIIIPILEKELK